MRDSPQIRWISHYAHNLRGYQRNTTDYMVIMRFFHVDYLILKANSVVAFKRSRCIKIEGGNTEISFTEILCKLNIKIFHWKRNALCRRRKSRAFRYSRWQAHLYNVSLLQLIISVLMSTAKKPVISQYINLSV